MFEDFAKKKACELLLQVCYFPFVAVGGITVSFYDIVQMEKHPVIVYAVLVCFIHVALWAFWKLVFKRLLADVLQQMSFSKTAANVGLVAAYLVGLLIGWVVHKYG